MIEANNAKNQKVLAICGIVRTILGIPDNDVPVGTTGFNDPA
jgi:hypothetical protein